MPNVTIYLPDDLAAAAKLHNLSPSTAAQRDLRRQLRLAARRQGGDTTVAAVDAAIAARRGSPDRPAA